MVCGRERIASQISLLQYHVLISPSLIPHRQTFLKIRVPTYYPPMGGPLKCYNSMLMWTSCMPREAQILKLGECKGIELVDAEL